MARPISSRDDDIETLFCVEYEVHFNSARTGVRLIGPKPQWARARRRRGGTASLQHPRQRLCRRRHRFHRRHADYPRPRRAEPRRLCLSCRGGARRALEDGPAQAGRHACAFVAVSDDEAAAAERGMRRSVLARRPPSGDVLMRSMDQCRSSIAARATTTSWSNTARWRSTSRCGCACIVLMQAIGESKLARHHRSHARHPLAADPLRQRGCHAQDRLLSALCCAGARSARSAEQCRSPSRIVHLPLSWNDPQAQLAMRKYQELVRPNAPWCPSNIEFIRRINGLESDRRRPAHRVRRRLSRAGARRRLSRRAGRDAARSAASAGHDQIQSGAHLDAGKCRRHRRRLYVHLWHGRAGRLSVLRPHHPDVEPLAHDTSVSSKPWLLRFFDQIRFFPVSSEELLEARAAFPHGGYPLRIERGRFSLRRPSTIFSTANAKRSPRSKPRSSSFRGRTRSAGGSWGWIRMSSMPMMRQRADGEDLCRMACIPVHAPVTGTVWKIEVEPGQE